ncbi:hypothetical protein [Paenibacillus dokdonensis]|uniref:hypothetical protein n=1 Tax=Paenibacillus dokdonensis TaxID=2567944 RepID=UPI003D28AC05
MFKHRSIRPSVRQKLEEDSEKYLAVARKRNQPDTSAPIAAGSWRSLKSVGRREHMNVIGNIRVQ